MDQFEDSMLHSSLHAFEAAMVGHVRLPAVKLERVLLALDGSDQDATAREVAAYVAQRAGAEVLERTDLATGHDVSREALASGVQLIVLPAPFREDFAATLHDTLGSAVDIVLAEAHLPALVVRAPMTPVAPCFKDVLIPISVSGIKAALEMSWALALAPEGARLELLDVPDLSLLDEVKHLLGDSIDASALREEALKRAAARDSAPVVEAAREAGAPRGVTVEARIEVGQPLAIFDQATAGRSRLVVTSLPGAPGSPEFHRARDLALRSRCPVLFV
jgi:nucleotide-binding universal stress UspA family protein